MIWSVRKRHNLGSQALEILLDEEVVGYLSLTFVVKDTKKLDAIYDEFKRVVETLNIEKPNNVVITR